MQHITFLSFSALGDLVVLLPAIAEARRLYPDSHFTIVCQRPATVSLAVQLEIAEEIILIPQEARKSPMKLLQAMRVMRSLRPDITLQTFVSHGSFGNLMAGATKAPIRVGFEDGRFTDRLTHLLPLPPLERNYVEINLDLLRRLGHYEVQAPDGLRFLPFVEAKSKRFLENPPEKAYGRYVAVSVASDPKLSFKRWPAQKWATLCKMLKQAGIECVFIGADTEKENVAAVIDLAGSGINLAGQTDFADMALLLLSALAVIGTDGMPLHFASALGKRCVGIFGPTSAGFCGPFGTQHRNISLNLPCSPCYGPHSIGKPINCTTYECLNYMPAEIVFQAIIETTSEDDGGQKSLFSRMENEQIKKGTA